MANGSRRTSFFFGAPTARQPGQQSETPAQNKQTNKQTNKQKPNQINLVNSIKYTRDERTKNPKLADKAENSL